MSKICGECVFFPGCSRYEGKTHDSEEAETCRAYLVCEEDEEEVAPTTTTITGKRRGESMTKYVDADKLAAEGWHLQRTLRDQISISIETKQLSDVPAAAIIKTRGQWEREVIFGTRVLRCSACGKPQSYGKTSYCPNCGAEMEEDVYPSSQVYQVRARKNEQDQGIYQVPAPRSLHGVDRE